VNDAQGRVRRYAQDTKVPVDRTRAELERLLRSRGAEGFHAGWDQTRHIVEFLWKGKQIRFVLPRAAAAGKAAQTRVEQADRQRWRALYLVVRAKLEAVESGIAVFEEEFLSFIVVPGRNQTVGELLLPQLQAGAFDTSRLLPPAKEED
jgi:hypothetical protein